MKFYALIPFFSLLFLACQEAEIPEEIAKLDTKLPEKVDYNIHIKPLLSDRCFKCHGPDANKRQAELRLDTEDGAYASLKEGGYAIQGGDLGGSEVFHRIISTDPDKMMPTPESNLSLNNEEKALIIKWIQQGAEYKEQWSLAKIEKPDVPSVSNQSFISNPIDNFILAKLEQKGIKPSPQADKATLLHRVSMDLTGLPPTLAEVDNFLKDNSPNAYEKAVDRLLASPHFGERMAVDWLDLARYADSHGYQDDGLRNSYPYRDWVIGSFNQNLSYDKFVTWQLAGDLLPKPSKDMLVATHFNRNHPQTQEGGVVDEEYRNEYVIDRVGTFGKAFLGMSLECARCHDHKYDPISQKEFYQMYAFFNSNNESGIIPYNGEASPTVMLTTPEVENQLAFIRNKIKPLERVTTPSLYRNNFNRWLAVAEKTPEKFAKPTPFQVDKPLNASLVVAAKNNPKDEWRQDLIKPVSNYLSTKEAGLIAHFNFEKFEPKPKEEPKPIAEKKPVEKKKEKPKEIKPEEKPEPDKILVNIAETSTKGSVSGDLDRRPQLIKGKIGNAMKLIGDAGFNFGREMDFERNQPFSISLWVNHSKNGEITPLFQKANGEFEGHRGYRVMIQPDGTLMVNFSYVWPANCIDIRTLDKLPLNQWANVTLTYDGSSKASGVQLFLNGKEMSHQVLTDNLHKSILYGENKSHWSDMSFMVGQENRTTAKDLAIDELKVYYRQLSALEVREFAGNQSFIVNILRNKNRSEEETEALFEYYRLNFDPTFKSYFKFLTLWRERENQLLTDQKEVMTMSELPTPRQSFILNRGQYDQPTKTEVFPATPEKFLPFSSDLPQNRLGLSQWLLDEDNPLFSRVIVNRFWQQFFGKGIVLTTEDFGNQGNLPTHPELLDWLAVTFRESGWNVKTLLKTIALSNTYRQSSVTSQKLREIDVANELYARGPSYRYSHEQIRDKVLAASGLLVRNIGGPSMYPYQPEGLWEALATRNATSYKQQHGDSLYRRGLYTVWKRSTPPPAAITFDASERYFCVVRRQKTSTPLQSLVLMNDPQNMEAARILAERMIKEGGNTEEARISLAFKLLMSRPARSNELTILKKYLEEEKTTFAKSPQKAETLLAIGEKARDKNLNINELAAYTMVATTLINFDETVMKR